MVASAFRRQYWVSLAFSILSCSLCKASGFYDALEDTGNFTVETQSVQFELDTDTLQAEVYIPTATDGGDTEPLGLVLFMPGAGTSFIMYEDYLIHLASHGYLTVGLDFASQGFTTESEHDLKAQQALDVIAALQTMNEAYASLLVVTAGHSQGGKIAFYAASIDTNSSIVGVIAMDPVNAGGPPCFLFPDLCGKYPVAPNPRTGERGVMYQMNNGTGSIIFRSAPDFLTNPDEAFNARWFYYGSDEQGLDATPSPSWYYDFGDFAHTGYLPMFVSEQVQIIKRSMVAFLQQHVEGIDRTSYLTGDIIQSDVNDKYLVAVASR
jgi:pimeloyl-ACP methyl ester carboxylesterase